MNKFYNFGANLMHAAMQAFKKIIGAVALLLSFMGIVYSVIFCTGYISSCLGFVIPTKYHNDGDLLATGYVVFVLMAFISVVGCGIAKLFSKIKEIWQNS
jgi:hypothetical protein